MAKIVKIIETPLMEYKAGTVLFEEGSSGVGFFIIRKGTVSVMKNFGKPGQIEVAVVGEGKVLGEIAAIDGKPRTATAVAKTDTIAMQIPASSLKDQIDQCPTWFRAIVLDLVDRLRKSGEVLSKNHLENPGSHGS